MYGVFEDVMFFSHALRAGQSAMRLDAGTIEFEDVKFFYPFRLLESRLR